MQDPNGGKPTQPGVPRQGGGPDQPWLLSVTDPEPESGVLWGVGAVSQRLGIATPTLRTWDRRYGLGPSARTDGGHRRYSELDVARVARMSQLIAEGVLPSQAAQVSLRSVHDPAAVLSAPPATPLDDSALTGRGVSMTINAMLRATRELDSATLSKMIAQVFERRGVVAGWTEVVSPLLVAVGDAWARGEIGVEGEHLASECVSTELRHRVRYRHGRRPTSPPVLLASAADDQHSLPLVALAVALADKRVNTRVLGSRTPNSALAAAIDRVAPRVVFLWSSMHATGHLPDLGPAPAAGGPMVLLLGGPGWSRLPQRPESPLEIERSSDLPSAIARIGALVG